MDTETLVKLVRNIQEYGRRQMIVGQLSEIGSVDEYEKACNHAESKLIKINELLGDLHGSAVL